MSVTEFLSCNSLLLLRGILRAWLYLLQLFNSQSPLEGFSLLGCMLLHPSTTNENSLFNISFPTPTKKRGASVLFLHFWIRVILARFFSTKITSTRKLREMSIRLKFRLTKGKFPKFYRIRWYLNTNFIFWIYICQTSQLLCGNFFLGGERNMNKPLLSDTMI